MSALSWTWMWILPLAVLGQSPDRSELAIVAKISESLERIDLSITQQLIAATPLDRVTIVLPAERYRALPTSARPSDIRETFPSGFSEGGFERIAIAIRGRPCAPEREVLPGGEVVLSCPAEVAAGERVEIAIAAGLIVPQRYGSFGRVGRRLTLGGGWYPFASRAGAGPPRGPVRLEVEVPAAQIAVIGRTLFPAREEARSVVAELEAGEVPLVLRPPAGRSISIARGRAHYLSGPASEVQEGEESLHRREVRAALIEAIAFWEEEGLPPPTAERPLLAVEAPLRRYLAEPAEGLTMISDRAFRMLDVDRFLRFHRFPILRELFLELASRQLPETSSAEHFLTADAIASWLLDRYVASRFGRAEDAFDVLGIVSFIPSIDSMLYAPDLPFVSAYFRVIREDDPLHPDLLAPSAGLPRGKLIYEKLVDRVGAAQAAAAMKRALAGVPIADAVRGAIGDRDQAERFLGTWLGPYPDLRYRLSSWGSRPAPERCPGCWEATVEVEREGDSAEEPLGVVLLDQDGQARELTIPASAAPHRTFTATLAAPLDLVELDPHGRLAETPSDDNPAPRYQHRSSTPWKVLLNNFNIAIAASEGAIDSAIDVGLQRRYDLNWSFAVRGDYARDAIALSARAVRSFGPRASAGRLAHWLGLGVSGDYLRPGFPNATDKDGLATSLSLFYGYDDRESNWAPESGTGLRLGVDYERLLAGDRAEGQGGGDSLGVSVRALRQWMLSARHQLSLRASFATYLVGHPRPQQLYALGGRSAVRGYAQDAELGRTRAILSAEWLHPLLPRFETNGFFMAWVNGIDGALYGDAGLIGDDPAQAFRGPVFGDIGYGLRLYIDYLGVRPGVMSVDVAFPLVKARGATELGPPAVYIGFSQSFFGF